MLVQGVEHIKNALGYFGFAHYISHAQRMRAIPIERNGGASVAPSVATVIDGSYQPLSRPLFVYVSATAAKRPEIRRFIEFYLTEGPALAQEVGFIALPAQATAIALEHFRNNRLGTVFGGRPEVGVTIENLLSRDAVL